MRDTRINLRPFRPHLRTPSSNTTQKDDIIGELLLSHFLSADLLRLQKGLLFKRTKWIANLQAFAKVVT
jgi:hypothetical protein